MSGKGLCMQSGLLCVALLLGGCAAREQELPGQIAVPAAQVQAASAEDPPASPAPMQCPSFDRQLFARGVGTARMYSLPTPLQAGMVPHHLIASNLIAGFFALAAQGDESYDAVLLVAPSHFPENCSSDVVTARAGWESPVGFSPADVDIVDALLQNPRIAAENNPAAVEADHGVSGLVPFVQHYLPGVPVAVCLLANGLSRDRLEEVHRVVDGLCGDESKNILLVASVDCSHYLLPAEAMERDKQTAAAIEALDIQRVLGFTDSNVDSPQALSTLLARVTGGSLELHQLDHSSSADILPHAASNPVYHEGITTYFVYGAAEPAS